MFPRVCLCAGEAVGLQVWLGCAAALTGSVLMSVPHSEAAASGGALAGGVAKGDALLVLAALLWSVQVGGARCSRFLHMRAVSAALGSESACKGARAVSGCMSTAKI